MDHHVAAALGRRGNSNLHNGLRFLATVGSTAPFVGLFGTVWGILNALIAIGIAGQASIDKVAGPVGEALIMTALGLFVAVPAVMGYNWLLRRNKALQDACATSRATCMPTWSAAPAWLRARQVAGGARPAAAPGRRGPQVR